MSYKLSILVPNYNGGENLKRAIESCENLSLSEEDYKITVIDNQSTDNSIELVGEIQEKKDNVELIQNEENLGRIGNWNKSIEVAEGEYSLFLFVNEQIAPKNNIAEMLEKMEDENVKIGKSRFQYVSDYKENPGEEEYELKIDSIRKKLRRDILLVGEPRFAPLQTFVIETETLKKNRFDEDYEIIGDQDYIISLGQKMEDDAVVLTKSMNILWDDEDEGRFHSAMEKVEELNEIIDWYRKEKISSYSGLPLEAYLLVRLSKINVLGLSDRLFGEEKLSDREVKKEKQVIRENSGIKYYAINILSYFYPPTWYRKITGII